MSLSHRETLGADRACWARRAQGWGGGEAGCDAVTAVASAHPPGSPGAGMAFQSCPESGQGGWDPVVPHLDSSFVIGCPKRGV